MEDLHQQLLAKIKTYQMPAAAVSVLTQHPPLLIVGTTAAGKDVVVQAIQDGDVVAKVVTHTTRQPRPREQNGEAYWFVTEEQMLQLLEEQKMIEVKQIHELQISGTSIEAYQAVVDQNRRPLLNIDVQGVEEVMNRIPELRPVFILPPSFEAWMERLDQRGAMSHVERLRRLHSAREELEIALNNKQFILVVNDVIAKAAHDVLNLTADQPTQDHNRALVQRLIDHIKAY